MDVKMKNHVLDGLMGVCVGDALGLPVQFALRSSRKTNPVSGMTGHGVFNLPPGTWSDDSSLTFCLAESLCSGYDLNDMGMRFKQWLCKGYWTPFGQAFDIGGTTYSAILRLRSGASPQESGDRGERQNGNGSLMRILPLSFYLQNADTASRFEKIHEVSAITHAHPRSLIACGIYVSVALCILEHLGLREAYEKMQEIALQYYTRDPFQKELHHFDRLLRDDVSRYAEPDIHSSGYVVHTLEASLWCLLNNLNYRDTVLLAVNLGDDTDTTAAVAGGLAGLLYGYSGIPEEWVRAIQKKDEIIDLSQRLFENLPA
jgi:ADP-ribosylglycohydrolase